MQFLVRYWILTSLDFTPGPEPLVYSIKRQPYLPRIPYDLKGNPRFLQVFFQRVVGDGPGRQNDRIGR